MQGGGYVGGAEQKELPTNINNWQGREEEEERREESKKKTGGGSGARKKMSK